MNRTHEHTIRKIFTMILFLQMLALSSDLYREIGGDVVISILLASLFLLPLYITEYDIYKNVVCIFYDPCGISNVNIISCIISIATALLYILSIFIEIFSAVLWKWLLIYIAARLICIIAGKRRHAE